MECVRMSDALYYFPNTISTTVSASPTQAGSMLQPSAVGIYTAPCADNEATAQERTLSFAFQAASAWSILV